MYKEILRSIAGIEVFPMISLCLFVAIFAVMLIRTSRIDAARLDQLARLPLDGDEAESSHANPSGAQL
jgi:hypothetical protein